MSGKRCGRSRAEIFFSSDSVVPFTLTPIRGHDRRRIEPIRDRRQSFVFFVFRALTFSFFALRFSFFALCFVFAQRDPRSELRVSAKGSLILL